MKNYSTEAKIVKYRIALWKIALNLNVTNIINLIGQWGTVFTMGDGDVRAMQYLVISQLVEWLIRAFFVFVVMKIPMTAAMVPGRQSSRLKSQIRWTNAGL